MTSPIASQYRTRRVYEITSPEGRRHLRLFVQAGQIMVEDMDSTNGTLLNGQRLAPRQPQPVRDGDQIQPGKIVLRLQM